MNVASNKMAPRIMYPIILAAFSEDDFAVADVDHHVWRRAETALVSRYWSGRAAPGERRFEARLIWSRSSLYVRFDVVQREPLIVSDIPNLESKTLGLWDRDVCEIFIAPDRTEPRRYFEFEIAPNGEWLDVAIDSTAKERVTDWDYNSGMETFARVEKEKVTMAMKIPWTAFGRTPSAGDVWLGNLFRCVGSRSNRGYLAYNPTETPEPNFHAPEQFVEFRFSK